MRGEDLKATHSNTAKEYAAEKRQQKFYKLSKLWKINISSRD